MTFPLGKNATAVVFPVSRKNGAKYRRGELVDEILAPIHLVTASRKVFLNTIVCFHFGPLVSIR